MSSRGAFNAQVRADKSRQPRLPQEGYWSGATWVYHAEVTNDAGITANHEYDVVPGADNEFEFGYGYLQNGSTSAGRNGFVLLNANDDIVAVLLKFQNIPLGIRASFPDKFTYGTGPHEQIGYGGTKIWVSGEMELHAEIDAVSSNQFSEFALVVRARGSKPIVTITTSDPGVDVNVRTDEFF